ncbi:MAG: branched-chain amino acid ABC transporter permease [Alphaproteobacteria bacterium]
MSKPVLYVIGLLALASVPFIGTPQYYMHIMITILIWSFCYTGWSLMGRFGLVSLGHGAFMSIGAYSTALMWNHLELTPWLGVPAALITAAIVAFVVGYPCFRFKIIGHYFALVTLALSEVVRLVIIAERDNTGGSLGYTPERYQEGYSIFALQFPDKEVFYLIALAVWAIGLVIWHLVDRSMLRYALDSVAEDEDASASAGVWVSMTKLRVTVLSAVMTAFAGVMYTQYQMFIAPDTVGGIGVSLQIVFATVAGGMYVMLGPTVGAIITILLAETLRVMIGVSMVGLDTTIYGLMLVLFIIFLPKGVLGETLARLESRRERAAGRSVAASS